MHPRDRRTSRRQFLFASAGAAAALSGADALFRGGGRARRRGSARRSGPGGIPLARRNFPVTLPLYSDNEAIGSGKRHGTRPAQRLQLVGLHQPGVVKAFQKEFGVKVNVTTFENEEEALAKLTSGKRRSTSGSRPSSTCRAQWRAS